VVGDLEEEEEAPPPPGVSPLDQHFPPEQKGGEA
jgi:hypothetical protein